ncbi:Rap/ran-GAP family protein [Brugia malayi]|uniref:BMA-SIPA-1 n=2 Tax=Brugia TaxID=6278 RepID=A0A0K0JLH8_BRUMA|nr:Rap/ran-GAP family protein [Brugia malayi]CRZ24415.1 BMA-SIPA-1 [Brugia malayi]VIO98373.1 Rap/ran-GAP family protein [Brugia malayi]
MDSGQPADAWCSSTARALDIFNRRGSLLAVALGGVNSEAVASLPTYNSPKATAPAPYSSSYQYNDHNISTTMTSCPTHGFATTSSVASSGSVQNNVAASQYDTRVAIDGDCSSQIVSERINEWRPCYPRLCAHHDCVSLASAWGLGPPTTSLEPRPTGASQAQSPCEDDMGDGKSNDLLANCPAFRNELGGEPIRRLALSRRFSAASKDELKNKDETWQREHTASEIGILEDVSNVYLGGRLCAARQQKVVIEPQDIGAYYYRHCFLGRPHWNFFGTDETLGPVAVSVVRERIESGIQNVTIYRMIVRLSDLCTLRVAIPEEVVSDNNTDQKNTRSLIKELLEIACPQIHYGILRPANPSFTRVEDFLVKIDEQPIYTRYKVGVMYCGVCQSTEEQMYNNESGSPAFEEFLDFLGQRVRLKGFDQYKGGLDVRGDTTGTHSIYVKYQAHEIMFHVSTLLPFTPSNKQQLARKRHIGNDMVTVIFQEPGALPFSPITVRSHFQHVFIIVRANNPCTDDVTYSIAVSRAKDVPAFGPAVPQGATFPKSAEFHDFFITKIINAENAVHRSKKFAAMAARTRREALKEIAENFSSAHPNDGPAKIASRFLVGSVKRKERSLPRPVLSESLHGALSWLVEVHDHSQNQSITCVLGLSSETLAILEMPSGQVICAIPTHSIIGWANTDSGLKIYFDHGDVLLLRCRTTDNSDRELTALIRRLECVTKGDEAKEVLHRRARTSDNLGFHLQEEGVVTDVEMYHTAWRCGLRQGSRIVEIEGKPIVTMSYNEICDLMAHRTSLRLIMILPASDGSPRRGCADPHCPAVSGDERLLLMPDTFAKRNMNYLSSFKNEQLRMLNNWDKTRKQSSSFEDESIAWNRHNAATKLARYERVSCYVRYERPANTEPVKWKVLNNCLYESTYKVQGRILRVRSEDSLISSSENCRNTYSQSRSDTYGRSISLISKTGESGKIVAKKNAELEKSKTQLQKTLREKQALEAMISRLKEELTKERRAHEMTKLELQKLQKYFEMLPNVSL